MSLIEMVDTPMREPVALLNLLGCKTAWSCCGYHYRDEPEGKSHMLGNVQILMLADERAFTVITHLLHAHEMFSAYPKWTALLDGKPLQGAVFNLMFNFPVRKEECWWNPNSAHFHEGPVLAITHLSNALRTMEAMMEDEVTLKDTNASMKEKTNGAWDFPPSGDWVIRKADYFPEIIAEIEIGKQALVAQQG